MILYISASRFENLYGEMKLKYPGWSSFSLKAFEAKFKCLEFAFETRFDNGIFETVSAVLYSLKRKHLIKSLDDMKEARSGEYIYCAGKLTVNETKTNKEDKYTSYQTFDEGAKLKLVLKPDTKDFYDTINFECSVKNLRFFNRLSSGEYTWNSSELFLRSNGLHVEMIFQVISDDENQKIIDGLPLIITNYNETLKQYI